MNESDLFPYPESVPDSVVQIAIQAIEGNLPDVHTGTHAVLHVTAYSAGQWDKASDGAPKMALANVTPMSKEDIVKHLRSFNAKAAAPTAPIPWDQLVIGLMQLIWKIFGPMA